LADYRQDEQAAASGWGQPQSDKSITCQSNINLAGAGHYYSLLLASSSIPAITISMY